jgi:methylmalonyl-CoA mutase C-terminal domain/subunit
MEVVYTGRHVEVAFTAQTAVQEDVDVVGLSILSGAHVALTAALLEALEELGARDEVAIVVGGTIPTRALRDELLGMGIADVFPGGTPLPQVVEGVRQAAAQRRARLVD